MPRFPKKRYVASWVLAKAFLLDGSRFQRYIKMSKGAPLTSGPCPGSVLNKAKAQMVHGKPRVVPKKAVPRMSPMQLELRQLMLMDCLVSRRARDWTR